MNWTDAMKNNADVVSRFGVPAGPTGTRVAAPTGWDPHEVWLSRVKEPRERAARRVADNAPVAALDSSGSAPR